MAIISTVPIGASKGNVAPTISGYVDYLHNGRAGDLQLREPSGDGVIRYYADTVEGPGIWNGTGARHLGLKGQVDRHDFEELLNGRTRINETNFFTQDGLGEIAALVEADDEVRYERSSVGNSTDLLSTKDVASLTGVSQRHVQQMAKYYETNQTDIDAAGPDGLGNLKQRIKSQTRA